MHELVESVCRSMLPIETNRFHYFTTSLFVFFGRPFRLYSFFFIGKASSKSTFNYLSFNWFTIVVRIRRKRKVTILLDFVVWLISVVYVLHSTRIS